jgi:hypothetical protein
MIFACRKSDFFCMGVSRFFRFPIQKSLRKKIFSGLCSGWRGAGPKQPGGYMRKEVQRRKPKHAPVQPGFSQRALAVLKAPAAPPARARAPDATTVSDDSSGLGPTIPPINLCVYRNLPGPVYVRIELVCPVCMHLLCAMAVPPSHDSFPCLCRMAG